MKKFISTFIMMAMMAIMLPLAANAQTRNERYYRNRTNTTRVYHRPSFYRRHKNLIDIGIGTGGGALLGGLLRGRRGAGYGALIGAGSGALYTYVLKPKRQRGYRNR